MPGAGLGILHRAGLGEHHGAGLGTCHGAGLGAHHGAELGICHGAGLGILHEAGLGTSHGAGLPVGTGTTVNRQGCKLMSGVFPKQPGCCRGCFGWSQAWLRCLERHSGINETWPGPCRCAVLQLSVAAPADVQCCRPARLPGRGVGTAASIPPMGTDSPTPLHKCRAELICI